jgi:hypothetical protein
MRSIRKRARDRRLERRLARKVTKTGKTYAPEVYDAYLAGLQKGLQIQEEQQAALQCVSYHDIFGNEVGCMKIRDMQVDESNFAAAEVSLSVSVH